MSAVEHAAAVKALRELGRALSRLATRVPGDAGRDLSMLADSAASLVVRFELIGPKGDR